MPSRFADAYVRLASAREPVSFWRSATRSLTLLALALLCQRVEAQATDAKLPNNTCILEITLPLGATVTLDGKNYETQRRFTYNRLTPGKRYTSKLAIQFSDGTREEHSIFLQGGRHIAFSRVAKDTGLPELVLQSGHADVITAKAFSHNGRYILTGSNDRTAILWDTATGRQLRHFVGTTHPIGAVAFSGDDRYALIGTTDAFLRDSTAPHAVHVWDIQTGERVHELVTNISSIKALAASPDGRYVVGASVRYGRGAEPSVGLAFVWDLRSGDLVRTLEHGTKVVALAFDDGGRRLVTSADPGFAEMRDDPVAVWAFPSGERVETIPLRHKPIAVSFGPDSQRLLAVTGLGDLLVHDSSSSEVSTLYSDGSGSSLLACTPDGEKVLVGRERASHALLLNAATGDPLKLFGPYKELRALAVSSDGRFACTVGAVAAGLRVDLWDLTDGTRSSSLEPPSNPGIPAGFTAFSDDGRYLALRKSIVELESGAVVYQSRGELLAFGPRPGTVLERRRESTNDRKQSSVVLIDFVRQEAMLTFDLGDRNLGAAAVSPASELIYLYTYKRLGKRKVRSGTFEQEVEIYERIGKFFDVQTGDARRSLSFDDDQTWFQKAVFSPDGRILLTTDGGNHVALWHPATGKRLRTLEVPPTREQRQRQAQGHAVHLNARLSIAAFTSEGRKIVALADAIDTERKGIVTWSVTGELLNSIPALECQSAAWDASESRALMILSGTTGARHVAGLFSIDVQTAETTKLSSLDLSADPDVDEPAEFWQARLHLNGQFSSDGKQVLIGARGMSVCDVASGGRLFSLPGAARRGAWWRPPAAFTIHPETLLWAQGGSGGASLHDLSSPHGRRSIPSARDEFVLALDRTGRYVLTVSEDGGDPTIWDAQNGTGICQLTGLAKQLSGAAFSPDATRVMTAGGLASKEPAELVLWDATTGDRLRQFHGQQGPVRSIAFSPDTHRLLTSGAEAAVLWDVRTGRKLRVFPRESQGMYAVMSADGRLIATNANEKGRMRPKTEITSLFQAVEEITVLQTSTEAAHLWDASTGNKLRTFKHANLSWASSHVGLSPDSRLIVTTGTRVSDPLIVWDARTGTALRLLQFGERTANVSAINFLPDNRHLLVHVFNGTSELWDSDTGALVARLALLDDGRDWLLITPEGLFDGGVAAREKVMFRVGGGLDVVPADRFFQDFYRPGLLTELLAGRRPLPDVDLSQSWAPLVQIVTPSTETVIETPQVVIEVEITDRGGGIRGPWLLHNGARIIAEGDSRTEGRTLYRTFTVPLVEGENRLEVRAASEDGSWESEPAVLVLRCEQPLAKPDLYLLAVGIDRYTEESINLSYAADDAQAIAELFQERGPAIYGDGRVHAFVLLDEQATKAAIRDALTEIAGKAKPQDVLVVFLAGHGTMVGQRYYYITHEFRKQANSLEEDIRSQGLASDLLGDWLAAVPSVKRLQIYDTCHSGGAFGGMRTARNPFALRGAIERLSRSQGGFAIYAAAATAEAQEIPQLGHGVLTYALLAGVGRVNEGPLQGQTLKPANAPLVEVRDWFSYAQDKVPLLTKLMLGQEQFVEFHASGQSFPVLPLE